MADNVFVNGRAVVHKNSAGQSVAFPDVCLCPPTPPAGPVPTPLPNTVKAADLDGGAATVLVEGNPVGTKSSFFKLSTGNEVSRPTGGGLITHGVQGKAYFKSFAIDVMFEGQPAVRHMDLLTHNHIAPAPGNTPPAPWMSAMAPPVPTGAPPNKEQSRSKGKHEPKQWKLWVELDPSHPDSDKDELVLVDAGGVEVGRVKLASMAKDGAGKVAIFEDVDLDARYTLLREYGNEHGGAVALFVDFSPNELDDFSEDDA